jgi:hypothetical protein
MLADIEIGINNAQSLQALQKRLHQTRPSIENSLEDSLEYLVQSLLKEKMWMSNYRDQSNVTLTLLSIVVGQQDAKDNLDIASSSQKLAAAAAKDSRSMNSIAALTMLFLPGIFFAVRPPSLTPFPLTPQPISTPQPLTALPFPQTLVGTSLFQESPDRRVTSGPSLCFWAALTGPVTCCVVLAWL